MTTSAKIENLIGALALALGDDLLQAAQGQVEASVPAAAIALISHHPGLTIDGLRRGLKLSHPGAVRVVDRLVQDGLATRQRSARDGRAVELTLTVAGEEACQRLLASRQRTLARAVSWLDPQDQATLGRLVETMLRGLLQSGEHALTVCRLCDTAVCPACPVEAEITARLTVDAR